MSKLESGYYAYSPNKGIYFLGTNLFASEFKPDTILISPSAFHQIVAESNQYECNDTVITYFKYDDYILHDLHFFYDIEGLKNV